MVMNRKYEDTCLIDAFRAHRIKVPYERSGPFYAVHDGQRLLAPFSQSITRCAWQDLSARGQFVVGYENHFVAVRRTDNGLEVNFTNKSHLWHPCRLSNLFPMAFHRPELQSACYLNPKYIDAVFRLSDTKELPADHARSGLAGYKGASAPERDSVLSMLVQYIAQRIAFHRIQSIQQVARRHIQELVTRPTLWLRLPNPLDASIDGRTWEYWVASFEHAAMQVTASVEASSMVASRRQPNGEPCGHSLSDVDRAIKRLDAWARIMMQLIQYAEAVDLTLMLSPVDPAISKRVWERHLFNIRQSLEVLAETVPSYVNSFIDLSPDVYRQDYMGGVTVKTMSATRNGSLSEINACISREI